MPDSNEPIASVRVRIQAPATGEQAVPLAIPGHYVNGSGENATVKLAEQANLSPRHELFPEATSARVGDLDSVAGTFMNGQKIDAVDLRDGDLLRCGEVSISLRFERGGAFSQTVTPAQATAAAVATAESLLAAL